MAGTTPDTAVSDEDRKFWSFRPPAPVAIPAVHETRRLRNPIDAFIQRKLENNGLTLGPETDRLTLMRRAYLDLTGLLPSPEEIQAYLADREPGAYERLIDRLLASPHYGERWGRYWLDLAGYADSDGHFADSVRPFAFRYRDYVIRSFNADKPYDRFLLEQIAGDELADYEHGPVTPEIMDNLIATGFLRMAPDGTNPMELNRVPERLDAIADELEVFGSAVLGLTIQWLAVTITNTTRFRSATIIAYRPSSKGHSTSTIGCGRISACCRRSLPRSGRNNRPTMRL